MLDLVIVKKDFASLMGNINPWMLSHFVMWLDIKVAEYKVYGHMVLDDTLNDTPKWLISQRSLQHSTDTSDHAEDVQIKPQSAEVLKRQMLTLPEESPAPAKQQRVRNVSHDQNRYASPQSSQIPQGHIATAQGHTAATQSFTQRPMPSLTRQPSNYRTENSAITQHSNEKQFTQVAVNNGSSNLPQQELGGHFEENASVQDILNNINISQIQLQERWSQEIEKSISQNGVKAIKIPEKDPDGKMSRSTIVLSESHTDQVGQSDELQKRLSLESPHKDSSKNVQEATEPFSQNMVKIELSSDEESLTGSTNVHQGETTSICDTGQEESFSSAAVDFTKDYSLQESNMREVVDDMCPVPVSIYSSCDKTPVKNKPEDESSWRNKKWDYFEKLRKSQNSSYVGAKVHSQSLQNLLPFPDPFPLENLVYGDRALQMINSGIISRSGKMQFLDTVFNEVVKYTGLYPSPQQKVDIAKAIVTSFPKLDTKTHPGHGSAIDSWLTVLNDKYRNERRQLNHGHYYRKPVRYVSNKKAKDKHILTQIPDMSKDNQMRSLSGQASYGIQDQSESLNNDTWNNVEQLQIMCGEMGDNSCVKTEPVNYGFSED